MKIKRFEVFEKFTQDEADELKSLPVYKTDRTSIISDPVVRISVIVKN